MRILLLSGEHPRVSGRTGGIGSVVASAGAALAAAGHEVHVMVCADGLANLDVPDGDVQLHVRGLAPALRPLRGQAPRLLAVAASCRWHARRLGRFDVVESPEWQALAAGFAVGRAVPLVISLQTPGSVIAAHDPRSPPPSRAADALERAVVRRADAVLSLSLLLVDELRATGWLPEGVDVQASPPVVDARVWSSVPSAIGTGPVVLGVGRLEPRKGFALLLDAVARVGEPDVRVELVGGDTDVGTGSGYARHLLDCADRLGVELRLHGPIPQERLREVLATSRVVALPSTFDSFNMAGFEAMASGRAVVITDRVGLGELDDGSGAITIVPSDSPDDLAGALAPLLADDQRAATAGEAARALVAAHGTDRFVSHREQCYQELTERRG